MSIKPASSLSTRVCKLSSSAWWAYLHLFPNAHATPSEILAHISVFIKRRLSLVLLVLLEISSCSSSWRFHPTCRRLPPSLRAVEEDGIRENLIFYVMVCFSDKYSVYGIDSTFLALRFSIDTKAVGRRWTGFLRGYNSPTCFLYGPFWHEIRLFIDDRSLRSRYVEWILTTV